MSTFNAKSPTIKRILSESRDLSTNPTPSLHAAPLDTNLFEWHFTIRGPPSTAYAMGIYHGRIILPPQYPLRPPSFRFLTPSGRFEVNREICLSISGHHEESWQPAWGIRTALTALRAFMEGSAKGQVGGMEMGEVERMRLAEGSRGWRCMGCGGRSNEEILREVEEDCEKGGVKGEGKGQVPDGLKLGYREDLVKKEDSAEAAVREPLQAQTDRLQSESSIDIEPKPPIASTNNSAPPQPTRITQQSPSPPISPSDATPTWIDKAIVGVVASLTVMVIKKMVI